MCGQVLEKLTDQRLFGFSLVLFLIMVRVGKGRAKTRSRDGARFDAEQVGRQPPSCLETPSDDTVEFDGTVQTTGICAPVSFACRAAADSDWGTYLRHARGTLSAVKAKATNLADRSAIAGQTWLMLRAFVERSRFDDASQRFEHVHAILERCIQDTAFLQLLRTVLIDSTEQDLIKVAAQSVARLAFAEQGRARLGAAGFIETLWASRKRQLEEGNWAAAGHLTEALAILFQYDANVDAFWCQGMDPERVFADLETEVQCSTDSQGPAFALEAMAALTAFYGPHFAPALVSRAAQLVVQATLTEVESSTATRGTAGNDERVSSGRLVAASAFSRQLVYQCQHPEAMRILYHQWLPLIRRAMAEAKWTASTTWSILSNAADVETLYQRLYPETERGTGIEVCPPDGGNADAMTAADAAGAKAVEKDLQKSSAERRRGQGAGRRAGRTRRSSVQVAS